MHQKAIVNFVILIGHDEAERGKVGDSEGGGGGEGGGGERGKNLVTDGAVSGLGGKMRDSGYPHNILVQPRVRNMATKRRFERPIATTYGNKSSCRVCKQKTETTESLSV